MTPQPTLGGWKTDKEEVDELKHKFGIGTAALAASSIVKLRRRAAEAAARRRQERTAELPRSALQKAAARNVVSFEAEGPPGAATEVLVVHQRAIRG